MNMKEKTERMKNLGEFLRQRRKELNFSLRDVENMTSIRLTQLQAIEEGEFSKLISPVYMQGFVRQYATFLNLDGEKIIRENPELFARPEAQEFSYGIGTLEIRGNPGANVKWFPNMLWIFLSLGVIAVAWYTAKFFDLF